MRLPRNQLANYRTARRASLVPIDVPPVVQALNQQAKGGDVQAARELRAWLDSRPHVLTDVVLEDQPQDVRNRLLRRLLAELGEEQDQEGEQDEARRARVPV